MRQATHLISLLVLTCLTEFPVIGQDSPLPAQEGEFVFGPLDLPVTYEGLNLVLSSWLFLRLDESEDRFNIGGRILCDLSALQNNIGYLVEHIPLPSDRCDGESRATIQYALTTRSQTLSPRGEQAVFHVTGDLDACLWAKNPIPCTKLEGFKLITWDCNPPIVKRFNGGVSASAPLRLSIADDARGVELVHDQPTIHLSGSVRDVAGLLEFLGVDLETELQRLLASVIDLNGLQDHLPQALRELEPTFSTARFFDQAGSLAVELALQVRLDREALLEGQLRPASVRR